MKSGGDAFETGCVTGALVQGPKLTLESDNTKINTDCRKNAFHDTDSQLYKVNVDGYGVTFCIFLPDDDVASWLYGIVMNR